MNTPPRVRIAPSPTGDPHVGTAYTALFNYALAKKHGGKFLLRIEDTDRTRFNASSQQAIMDSLSWLGVDWDEGPDKGGERGPYLQSERTETYRKHVDMLLEKGKVYPCFCDAERLDAVRAKCREEKRQPKYDRHCLHLTAEEVKAKKEQGINHVVRMLVPEGENVAFEDGIRGKVEIPLAQLDDQVLLKSDGFPTYHLANVVDDHLMGITHVIRAEEWISSTPKHVLLYRAFDWETPNWIHLPLLRNKDKSKISKRKNPVSLLYYKDHGFLPKALVNFLALMGWSYGDDREVFSLPEMLDKFELSGLKAGGPVFDMDKLRWLNQQYIQDLEWDEFFESFVQVAKPDGVDFDVEKEDLRRVFPLMKERLDTLQEVYTRHSYFFTDKVDLTGLSVLPKKMEKDTFVEKFSHLPSALTACNWTEDGIDACLKEYKEKHDLKPRDFFMPIRLMTSGRKDSPPLVPMLVELGKEKVVARVNDCLSTL